MKPENFAERKKILFWLGALVAASILLLLLGLIFIYGRQALVAEARPPAGKPLAGEGLEKAGTMLNTYAGQLLQLDRTFSRQLTDSVSSLSMIEKTRQDIGTQEKELEKTLDSLDRLGPEYGPLIGSFRSLLTGHHELTLLSDAGPSGREEPSDSLKLQLSKAKSELRIKNDLIARLQKIGTDESGSGDRNGDIRLRSEYVALQEQFDQQEQNARQLRQQVENLRHTNENLLARLKETRSAGAQTDGRVADSRPGDDPRYSGNTQNTALEHKPSGLSDELRFAQVDCNLSRADARQVVYNAKQRKDLLTDALTTLNDLARSQDPEVQKKARERLGLLRSIASSVHD